jgi:hypothetical protein
LPSGSRALLNDFRAKGSGHNIANAFKMRHGSLS